MKTMTLEIDSPSIFEDLKNVIGLMRGVKIIDVTDNMGLEIPNETTLSAMKEAESGEDAGIVNIDSVEGVETTVTIHLPLKTPHGGELRCMK